MDPDMIKLCGLAYPCRLKKFLAAPSSSKLVQVRGMGVKKNTQAHSILRRELSLIAARLIQGADF